MLVSKKQGAKYGLIQPKQAAQPLKPSLAVFGDEDEPADYQRGGVARDVARQADKKRADAKVRIKFLRSAKSCYLVHPS